jgi:hypothetical protein
MTATAADYDWFEDRLPVLSEAYCLTLARGLTPAEFLARLNAREQPACTGLDALAGPSGATWNAFDGRELFIGATTVAGAGGDWALGVEINGFLGVTPEVIVPVSAGTRVVSHFQNIEAVDRFYWVDDGDIRLSFEPLFASYREGSTPDALLDMMRDVGFELSEDDDTAVPHAAALALAERLTGVRVTAELLEEATYACGIVPVPQG